MRNKALPDVAETKNNLNHFLAQLAFPVCVLSANDHVAVFANNSFFKLFDQPAKTITGTSFFQIFAAIDEQALRNLFELVKKTGEPTTVTQLPLKSGMTGSPGFVSHTYIIQPVRDVSNEITSIVITAQELPKIFSEETLLVETETKFHKIIMQSTIPMVRLKGPGLSIEIANDAILDCIWFKKREEVQNKRLLDVFPELKTKQLPAMLQKVFVTGKGYRQIEVLEAFESVGRPKGRYLDIDFAPLTDSANVVAGVTLTINDVTDQVKARLQLEEAEQRMRLAIEASAMGTFDWNLETQHFSPSKRLIEIFGFSDDEPVTHQMLLHSFHPADKPARNAAFMASYQKGSLEYEARIIKPHFKAVSWVKVYGKIVYNEHRKPLRMYGTVTDITKEKNAVLALEESENRLNVALSTASLGTYDVDINTSDVICSPRLYEILDLPAGSATTRSDILNLIFPEDVNTRNEAHKAALLTGIVAYESRIVWRDGSLRWIRVNAKLLYDENKKANRILGTVMDITDQKFYIRQLEESEQRFKVVADTAPVMIWMSGIDMLCFFFNKGWLDFTGRTLEEEMGNGWAGGVHPDDVDRCFSIYTGAFSKREPFYMEYRLRMHTGEYHWISDNGVPRFSNDGVFLGYVGGCMDIDAQKVLNEQLTISEARLRIAALSGELGTWDYNPVTYDFFWDDASADIFGVAFLINGAANRFWSLVHPDDYALLLQKVRDALHPAGNASFDAEFRITDPRTNLLKWVSVKGRAFFNNESAYRFAGTAIDVTAKKLALEALQERELLFKTIANATPVGLWLTNEFAVNTFVNNTWINWTGIPFNEQLNAGWYKVVIDEDKQRVGDAFNESFRKQEKFSAQFRFVNKDKEIRWCLTEGYPYYNNTGQMAGYAGSVTDVTKQLEQIDALRKSEDRFRLLANAMPQFIWTSDAAGKLNYFNQSVFDYSGADAEDLREFGWLKIVHPDDQAENISRWQHAIDTGEDFFFEHRFRNKGGQYRWQLSRALAQKSSDGIIQMWIGTSTDIHDQKLFSEDLENKVRQRTAELERMNEAIIRQKEFVEVVLDSSLILVSVFDTEKHFISFNKKCEEVFGIQREKVVGQLFKDVFPGIEKSQTYTNVQRGLDGETFHVSSYKSSVNGRYYESYFAPLRNRDNNVYAVLMTAHDITDIVQSTEQVKLAYSILEEQNKALERSNQELESFSYVASHDLQEPLRKIQTFIELLHRNLDNKDVSEKYFEKITSSAQRMAALIRDVLNYSRLAKQGEPFSTVNLEEVIEHITTDFELLITEKKATIRCNPLPGIKGIPLQLHQLFTNLISNSLKFSTKEPLITISCELISRADAKKIQGLKKGLSYFRIIFADNGIGFEQQFAEKIFSIFQRLNNQQYSGTGIGLAICKKIVENHNGVIQAVSEPGNGATFNIYLPAEALEDN